MGERYIYDKECEVTNEVGSSQLYGIAAEYYDHTKGDDWISSPSSDCDETEYFRPPVPAQQSSFSQQVQNCNDTQEQMHNIMRCIDNQLNNGFSTDTYKIEYDRKTKRGFFIRYSGDPKWYYIERERTIRDHNNLHGGIAHTGKLKEKGVAVCGDILFSHVRKFKSEDRPGKHYYDVCFALNMTDFHHVVVEKKQLSHSKLCDTICSEVVYVGQESLCSSFFKDEILRLSEKNIEIMIPSRPGFYKDERYGWVFLERGRYEKLNDNDLPPAMCKRRIVRTTRTVNEVFKELQPIIGHCLQKKLLWSVRLISPLLMPLGMNGVAVRTIIAAIIDTTNQISTSAAILKTGDFEDYNVLSLQSSQAEIEKEISGARDGVAAFIGPLTAAESKYNAAKVNYIRNAAINANGADKTARALISLVGRFIPSDLPPEFVLTIDCKEMANDADVNKLRNGVLKFDAAYISYIENHFDAVEGLISSAAEQYKAEPVPGIEANNEALYIALTILRKLMSDCFEIELFSEEEFQYVTNLFQKSATEIVAPDYSVKDKFVTATIEMITEKSFSFMDISSAHKSYSGNGNTLILDRKNGFLNFTMNALDKIAERIPTVKNGAELAGILKACGTIKCTDNGARQITTPKGRSVFYSVYLSELGDDILRIIKYIDNIEFFMLPEEVPENFIPLVWFRGRCAGIVLDGKGLPNPHINICGLSGMGKNRGAYRNGECFLRLRSKFIFINIKGPITEDSLKDMGCPADKYDLFDLKTEGLPFNIFNVSDFIGKNAKVSYILNIICAAVNNLTDNQLNELSDYVNSIVDDDTQSFSLLELFEKFPKSRTIALQKKLTPLFNMMSAYTPKGEKYKYPSCREFIDDRSRITVLSIVQSNVTALRCTVYALLQSIFEHQILDSHTRVVLYADEMQKYTSDSPFQQWFAEGRQFNIVAAGITQEYRSKDNETRNFTSSAAIELFYPPTTVSADKVFKELDKEFSIEELCSGNLGDIFVKGFFWSAVEKRHKAAILCGKNDDEKFFELKSYPVNYYGTGY